MGTINTLEEEVEASRERHLPHCWFECLANSEL